VYPLPIKNDENIKELIKKKLGRFVKEVENKKILKLLTLIYKIDNPAK
jgi:hypothetical protein